METLLKKEALVKKEPLKVMTKEMDKYEWESKRKKAEAFEHLLAASKARELGFENQALMRINSALECYRTDCTHSLCRQSRKLGVKIDYCCTLEKGTLSAGWMIDMYNEKWVVSEAEHYDALIPVEAFDKLARLKANGVGLSNFMIGKPYVSPFPVQQPKKIPAWQKFLDEWILCDPLLLAELSIPRLKNDKKEVIVVIHRWW